MLCCSFPVFVFYCQKWEFLLAPNSAANARCPTAPRMNRKEHRLLSVQHTLRWTCCTYPIRPLPSCVLWVTVAPRTSRAPAPKQDITPGPAAGSRMDHSRPGHNTQGATERQVATVISNGQSTITARSQRDLDTRAASALPVAGMAALSGVRWVPVFGQRSATKADAMHG